MSHTKLVSAVRQGRVSSTAGAMRLFGVSKTTVMVWLREARAAGHQIATRTGGKWCVIEGDRK